MSNLPEQKVKGLERKLKKSEIDFMKLIEEQNLQRVLKLKRTRKNNILVGKSTKDENFISFCGRERERFLQNCFVCFRICAGSQCVKHLRIFYVRSAAGKVP